MSRRPSVADGQSLAAQVEGLFAPLLRILHAHPGGITEHALFGLLARHGARAFGKEAFADDLTLFRSHFLLFHALYRLSDELARRGEGTLAIDCLKILHIPFSSAAPHPGLVRGDALRSYYLDLRHLTQTTAADLRGMLDAFWQGYRRWDKRAEALDVLGLRDPVRDAEIKATYRRLALELHPDRGGDGTALQRVNAAVAILLPR